MTGPLAQIVALTCFGNAFLQGKDIGEFFPNNSTCMFCDRMTFVTFDNSSLGKAEEKEIAKTPNEWFSFIKSNGAKGVRLSRTPQNDPIISDRMSAGFVDGGGTWLIEVLLPMDRSEFWIARWEVWNQDAPNQLIWRVTYGCVSKGVTSVIKLPDMQDIESRLTQALREIYSFSIKHNCDGFTQWFTDALDTLDSKGKNLHGYHKDWAPDGFLSSQAKMILDACQKSWVFGGMGSWNDMGFDGDDQVENERVSGQLFQVINEAITAAANTSYYGLKQG